MCDFNGMAMGVLLPQRSMPPRNLVDSLDIQLIIADGDFDGLVAAAVLKTAWPEASVFFSHPTEIRSGSLEKLINSKTAICDLPFHPNCGLYIDHHATNRPTKEQEKTFIDNGGHIHWCEADSAARVAYDLFLPLFDLSALTPIMYMVDRLDGGRISIDEFLSDDATIWLARTVTSSDQQYTTKILNKLVEGESVSDIVNDSVVAERINNKKEEMKEIRTILDSKSRIENRLAICELQETGLHTNGYLVTAHYGDDCDACLIIHGSQNNKIGDNTRLLSASFYTNSFLHPNGGLFDLTKLATMFDPFGGGHRNACGCRIVPLDGDGRIEERDLSPEDIVANLSAWLMAWNQSQSTNN
ncbi:MAG TPA: hypothetical protein HA340_03920 [Candidatus Thalassarchaeaceae archaeon]|jgi:hypothetical protein|nr:hypothetical protein [Euryarchaeota archaeon]DAC50301.1 MAG TPA: hypothetical protein D7H97_03880 [Candidatus Poseidoniales archaeon]HIH83075.1 hypothetical protein [Candidatus Thalassarchaeaceae archaeon]|tara:strand:+ start:7121 stop:8191 length:1071 start_codon:yes stop_codon:yes gene_type:complete